MAGFTEQCSHCRTSSGQVSIGVVEHAMFWDLPPVGTLDVVCNRRRLRSGHRRFLKERGVSASKVPLA